MVVTLHGTRWTLGESPRASRQRYSGRDSPTIASMRHAFATLKLEDGEELALVSRMLGAGSPSPYYPARRSWTLTFVPHAEGARRPRDPAPQGIDARLSSSKMG